MGSMVTELHNSMDTGDICAGLQGNISLTFSSTMTSASSTSVSKDKI